LEKKIKDQEASLEKKDFLLQTMEGSLAEAQAEVAKLNDELLRKSESLEQEKKNFDAKLEAEVEKSSNLQKSLKELQDKCLNFGNRCVQRLKQVFNSVGPALTNLNLRLKTCQAPSNILREKLRRLTKLYLGMVTFLPC
jgi:chromosome segregation ATPase